MLHCYVIEYWLGYDIMGWIVYMGIWYVLTFRFVYTVLGMWV
jgi:hypothetical protein